MSILTLDRRVIVPYTGYVKHVALLQHGARRRGEAVVRQAPQARLPAGKPGSGGGGPDASGPAKDCGGGGGPALSGGGPPPPRITWRSLLAHRSDPRQTTPRACGSACRATALARRHDGWSWSQEERDGCSRLQQVAAAATASVGAWWRRTCAASSAWKTCPTFMTRGSAGMVRKRARSSARPLDMPPSGLRGAAGLHGLQGAASRSCGGGGGRLPHEPRLPKRVLPRKGHPPAEGLAVGLWGAPAGPPGGSGGRAHDRLRTLLARQDWGSAGVLSARPAVASEEAKAARRRHGDALPGCGGVWIQAPPFMAWVYDVR